MTLLALLAVLIAPLADTLIPDGLKERFGEGAALPVLNVLASSMLAVTTFSLGVMVQASQSASSLATPRAYSILMADSTTQTVLATFVGAFLFSLSAIAMFRAHYYDKAAAVVVFFMTVIVIAAIIAAIIRWIGHLSQLGSLDHVLHLVEESAKPPLDALMDHPALGGHIASQGATAPPDAQPVLAARSGYLQFVDMPHLQERMEQIDAHLWIARRPGAYVVKGDPLAHVTHHDDLADALCDSFTLGKSRSLEQDARLGLLVMAETAARALSPGVNDPGTAIDVIHRLTSLLSRCKAPSQDQPMFDRITAPATNAEDLVEAGFDVLIRDGTGRVEVTEVLLKSFNRLADTEWTALSAAAQRRKTYTLELAETQGLLKTDIAFLRDLAKT